MDDIDDADLVGRCRAGDVAAWEVLIRRHRDTAWRAAVLFAGAERADDIVQEALVKAFVRIHQLRAGEGFAAWLVTIVRREAMNAARSDSRRRARDLRLVEPDQSGEDPSERAATAVDGAALVAALERLDDVDRDVLLCRYVLDLSTRETAAVLGCEVGTVKSRTSRALDRLKAVVA
jgi:RNA polymerase sigma-70 factor (ECF subfamily)